MGERETRVGDCVGYACLHELSCQLPRCLLTLLAGVYPGIGSLGCTTAGFAEGTAVRR